MLGLPLLEFLMFIFVVVVYMVASIIGVFQLRANGEKYRLLLRLLVCLALVFEVVMLLFRGLAINAFPLTGLFESIIVLTIVFGIMYLSLSVTIRQVWFGSVMVWLILLIILIAGSVAAPASQPRAIAATPWAIAHGIAMVLGGASLAFAATNAFLYLLNRGKLKKKKISHILGKIPNMEKLESMNLRALEACFLFVTFGIVSGIGMAVINVTSLGTSFADWMIDSKIILIAIVWLLLGLTVILRRMITLKGKAMAYLTITAFVLILFALTGTVVFCETKHDFVKSDTTVSEIKK